MKHCGKCKELKPFSEFYKSSSKGHGSYCKPCQHEHYKQRYHYRTKVLKLPWKRFNQEYKDRNQRFVAQYLKAHPCVDCGERDIIVLDFDHVRGQKWKEVSKLVLERASLSSLLSEIAKCEVRCSNCHRRKTATLAWARVRLAQEDVPPLRVGEKLALWRDP